jgi:nicotinate-nucleotide adenylyltransferase
MTFAPPWVGVYGGSFNPPHLGHLRLAVEVFEALAPLRLDLLPCAVPPHKDGRGMLPFTLRAAMLRESIAGIPGLAVSTLEEERAGPSYTSDTLRIYREREPAARLFFVLGAEDFASIRLWREWHVLPELADIVVVPRSGMELETFTRTVHSCWPEAKLLPPPAPATATYLTSCGGRLMHLPLPRLDIRAELIRERFQAGRCIRFLVPEGVERLLLENDGAARCWKNLAPAAAGK